MDTVLNAVKKQFILHIPGDFMLRRLNTRYVIRSTALRVDIIPETAGSIDDMEVSTCILDTKAIVMKQDPQVNVVALNRGSKKRILAEVRTAWRFLDSHWLDDQCINAVSLMLKNERVVVMNTQFLEHPNDVMDAYSLVDLSETRARGLDYICVPVNEKKNHWTLLIYWISGDKRQKALYDPFKGVLESHARAFRVEEQLFTRLNNDVKAPYKSNLPRQQDVNNCGIFILFAVHKLVEPDICSHFLDDHNVLDAAAYRSFLFGSLFNYSRLSEPALIRKNAGGGDGSFRAGDHDARGASAVTATTASAAGYGHGDGRFPARFAPGRYGAASDTGHGRGDGSLGDDDAYGASAATTATASAADYGRGDGRLLAGSFDARGRHGADTATTATASAAGYGRGDGRLLAGSFDARGRHGAGTATTATATASAADYGRGDGSLPTRSSFGVRGRHGDGSFRAGDDDETSPRNKQPRFARDE
jgi:hypothetical protein